MELDEGKPPANGGGQCKKTGDCPQPVRGQARSIIMTGGMRLAFLASIGLPILMACPCCKRVVVTGDSSIEHPAARVLADFLAAISAGDYTSAYELVAWEAKTRGDATLKDIKVSEEFFVAELAFDEGRIEELNAAVAEEKADRQKRADNELLSSSLWTPPSWPELRLQEQNKRRNLKCKNFHIGSVKQVQPARVEISLTTAMEDGITDSDTAILVKEGARWLVANPIHIIR